MALKFVVVLSFVCFLQSNEGVKLTTRQEIPLLNETCSMQEMMESLNAFSEECRHAFNQAFNFTNVATTLVPRDPKDVTMLCSAACSPTFQTHIERCHNELVETFQAFCLFNRDEIMCYTATYNSLIPYTNATWQFKTRAKCFVDFTIFANTTLTPSCSDGCRDSLQQFNKELGCCLNSIYNNSFVGKYLPFTEYSLWSNCGLISESPGFCDSSSTTVPSTTLFTAIFTLGTILSNVQRY